jgi:hypothetical protein
MPKTVQSSVNAVIAAAYEMPLVQAALSRLERELPNNLIYHAKGHTEDVLHEALRYGVMDNLSPRELELLAIAAAYSNSWIRREFGWLSNIIIS